MTSTRRSGPHARPVPASRTPELESLQDPVRLGIIGGGAIVQVAHLSGAALGAVLALGLLRRRSTGWWSPTRLAPAPGADTVAEKSSTADKK